MDRRKFLTGVAGVAGGLAVPDLMAQYPMFLKPKRPTPTPTPSPTGGGETPYWTANFEEGPSNGIDQYSGYEDFSFVQAEEADQANPVLSAVILASSVGITAHSGTCVGKFQTDHTAWLANLYHSKVYKQWQFSGSTTVQDVFGRNLQPAYNNSINGTYRCWYYVKSPYTTDWVNCFQWKLDEQDPFGQNPQWWVNISPSNTLVVNAWGNNPWSNPGGAKTLPLDQWFEIRADLWEGVKIDWYLNNNFWQTSPNSDWGIGRGEKADPASTVRSWVFGVGNYGEGGPLYVDDASYTPF